MEKAEEYIPQGRGDAGEIFSFGVFGVGGFCMRASTTSSTSSTRAVLL